MRRYGKYRSKLSVRLDRRCSRKGSTVFNRNRVLARDEFRELYTFERGKRYGDVWVFYRLLLRSLILDDILSWKHDWFNSNDCVDGCYRCEYSGKYYLASELEADHCDIKFRDLANNFAIENDLDVSWSLFKCIKGEPEAIEPVVVDKQSNINDILKSLVIKGDGNRPIGMNDAQYTKQVEDGLNHKKDMLRNKLFVDKSDKYLSEFADESLNDKWIEYHRAKAKLRMIHWQINRIF